MLAGPASRPVRLRGWVDLTAFTFLQRLLFMLLAPLSLLACTLPASWWLLREAGSEHGRRAILLRALPMALKVLFVVFPVVSAVAQSR